MHIARRTSLTLLAGLVLTLSFSLPASADSPITPGNRPTPVAGQTNGEMSSTNLIQVAPSCFAYRDAAPSLSLLLASARQRNIELNADECYRPLAEEIRDAQVWTARGNSACAASVPTGPNGPMGTSMHGWGKAVDFSFGGGSWDSPGYNYLKAVAANYGWNHPGWAEPGGSACPEAWHWEWVGDGGTAGASPIWADVVGLIPSSDDNGYATVTGLGAFNKKGDIVDHGSAASIPLAWVMVGATATPDRGGYWMVAADGGVFSFGDAAFYGSTGAMHLNQPVVAMAPTPSGHGYWSVAADGGVFSFGDAAFYGSTGAMHINKPVVNMIPTASGHGYWLIASDGGVFSFGDAKFYGSTGAIALNQPVVSGAVTASGNGYWMVASDGGVFSFGDAQFYGSLGSTAPAQPVVAMTRTKNGIGYWITTANADVYGFGNAHSF